MPENTLKNDRKKNYELYEGMEKQLGKQSNYK
jgi:hypothetical protein